MALVQGLVNNFNSGEVDPEAQVRTDLQPIEHGFDTGSNLICQIVGGLRKRRGFWNNGAVIDQTKLGRLIPFARGVTDALMLEFGDEIVRVWTNAGVPLLDGGGAQVTFASPYTAAQLAGLRYAQVADVIYLRHSTGLPPYALERITNTSWQFNLETFVNGPWLAENIVTANTLTFTGTTIVDGNPTGFGAAVIKHGNAVTIVAANDFFTNAMIGDSLRIRANTGSPGMRTWFAGFWIPVGWFITFNGNVYVCTATAGSAQQASMSTPPVQNNPDEIQNDGCNTFAFLHDGAGIVKITAVTDSKHASGTVLFTLPVGTGQATSCWSKSAYGNENGWPRAWPSIIEERLVNGATGANLDLLDLTRDAGFYPTYEDFRPGQGTGTVIATDALRRRLGDDGGEIYWTRTATFLLAGTDGGIYIVSGGLFGDPLTPTSIVCRELGNYGSEAVYPAKVHKGICFITTGGTALRKLTVDPQQNIVEDDLTFMAQHIAGRGIVQLAWVPFPDENLWTRLEDGTFAVLTQHDEQAVKGWASQALAGGIQSTPNGWYIEDIVTLPGPGRLQTLWMMVSRTKNAAPQRVILMHSMVADGLFMDFANYYAGPPATEIGGLLTFVGETVRCLANGVEIPDQVVVMGGAGGNDGVIVVPEGTTIALVGLPIPILFIGGKMEPFYYPGGVQLDRQRVPELLIDVKCTHCHVGTVNVEQVGLVNVPIGTPNLTRLVPRQRGDIPGTTARRITKKVTNTTDSSRDTRVMVKEDTAYDFALFCIRAMIEAGEE